MRIVRPQTLFASLCPVLIALLVGGVNRPIIAILTCLCSVDLQIFANLINDYYDFQRGTDAKGRIGFKRALAEQDVDVATMKKACYWVFLLAIFLGMPLVIVGQWFILCIGLLSLFFAWLYTATNHSLSYLGIADGFVLIFYGIVPAMGTEFLQQGFFSLRTVICGGICGLISMCVLIINNLRDIEGDKANDKRTFPVRFGKKNGERGMLAIILLMPLLLYYCWGVNVLMTVPLLALCLYWKVVHSEGSEYNRCLLLAGLLNSLYVLETAFYCLL